jgi:transposase-like protein
MAKKKREFTPEFKQQVVKYALANTQAEAARKFAVAGKEIGHNQVSQWVINFLKEHPGAKKETMKTVPAKKKPETKKPATKKAATKKPPTEKKPEAKKAEPKKVEAKKPVPAKAAVAKPISPVTKPVAKPVANTEPKAIIADDVLSVRIETSLEILYSLLPLAKGSPTAAWARQKLSRLIQLL